MGDCPHFLKGVPAVDYMLNPSCMTSVFMMPGEAVKAYIKLASAEQLRVLLFTMSNISAGIDPDAAADSLGIPCENVRDALNFWCDAGVFTRSTAEVEFTAPAQKSRAARTETPKPTREEIAMMGSTDEKVVFLLREAELKFRRPLRFSEMQSLVSLYADDGMDVSLILMVVEYAVSEGRASIGFINDTAAGWLAAGVDSVVAAEEQIEKYNRRKSAWVIVEKAFGIEHRKPSTKELEFAEKWIIEWGFSSQMLHEAYDNCVNSKAKLSMPYINKILESWHSKGFKTPSDIKAATQKRESSSSRRASNDELFEKLLNRD